MKKKKIVPSISPDEIFLDAENIPNFDSSQLEGKIEKPISQKVFWGAGIFFFFMFVALFLRACQLQVVHGDDFALRAKDNHLEKVILPAERGLIYDRNGELLAWNGASGREYSIQEGVSQVVGYTGFLYGQLVGKAGVEKVYNEILSGKEGLKLVEVSSKGKIISESVQTKPVSGNSVRLTIDADVQNKLYDILKNLAKDRGFTGGAGVVINVNNGELLSVVSYPQYNSQVLAQGKPKEKIEEYFSNPQKPFLNRAISGLYAPGSIIKPFIALAALNEKIIDPNKKIFCPASISIPNPYYPGKKSVFRDWKEHGWVDMKKALAVSSDVYFYTIGGGYGDIKALGINKIDNYMKLFGFGRKTKIALPGEEKGLVPSPEFKKSNSSDPIWRIGDTYITAIGQGDFLVTPLQMAVGTAMIAANGLKATPRLNLDKGKQEFRQKRINIPASYFNIVKEGMHEAVAYGTASGLSGIAVDVAAKTGTAELGSGKFVNSWLIAFWPYSNPHYALSIVLEHGRASNLIGGVYAARQLLEWLSIHKPDYLKGLTK